MYTQQDRCGGRVAARALTNNHSRAVARALVGATPGPWPGPW
jgi:hypothetical protein